MMVHAKVGIAQGVLEHFKGVEMVSKRMAKMLQRRES